MPTGALLSQFRTELRRQLEFESLRRGVKFIVIDRWSLSTKTFSVCGEINQYLTPRRASGSIYDRDVNEAINILDMAVSPTAPASGQERAGFVHEGGETAL